MVNYRNHLCIQLKTLWYHSTDTFTSLLVHCARLIQRSQMHYPHKCLATCSFDISLIVSLNKLLNNHFICDVTVMGRYFSLHGNDFGVYILCFTKIPITWIITRAKQPLSHTRKTQPGTPHAVPLRHCQTIYPTLETAYRFGGTSLLLNVGWKL